ncbi:leucine-rich repeat domain-containing protein [Marinicellulosiphila megalodicopiae]|uniref:leucine-rich repeat domain-containing protein n=1 Tax=Marinicellulosiphila megalodicopiae TaxID=2724896 RepID=UPI003BB0D192
MQTLAQLDNSELIGVTRLQLSENLTRFPEAIFDLAESLEILDLSNNQLSDLPEDLHRLTKLKILFCSNNAFTQIPTCLAKCPQLEMIGFKSNQIAKVDERALPLITRWLILTDNQITKLPESIGKLHRLQKLALAGNQLSALPASIAECKNLELIRLSANKLEQFPDVLLDLPKLAWLAFSGNPCCDARDQHEEFKTVKFADVTLLEVLGQGASGVISKAQWIKNEFDFPAEIAVKVFKGKITSDGYPIDELDACLATGEHPNLVTPLAKISQEDCSALIMELIPRDYYNLGQPPSLQSCTRDTFTKGQKFNIQQIKKIIEQMDVLHQHFSDKNISHGDLYAHNVMLNQDDHVLLGDFGAASKYGHLTLKQKQGVQRIETRALQFFIEDMLSLCDSCDVNSKEYAKLKQRI